MRALVVGVPLMRDLGLAGGFLCEKAQGKTVRCSDPGFAGQRFGSEVGITHNTTILYIVVDRSCLERFTPSHL